MGYWFLFYFIGIPLLMFSAKPSSSRWWRMGRSAIAFIIGYGVTMILFYIDCLYFKTVHGRIGAHWFVMGWLWTLTYIGWWELVWRIRYRRSLISIRKGLGDDWINGKILVTSIFGTLLFLYLVVVLIITHLQIHGIISR